MTKLLGDRIKSLKVKLSALSNAGKFKIESESLQARVKEVQNLSGKEATPESLDLPYNQQTCHSYRLVDNQ